MGGITDVSKLQADDIRHFILAAQEREKWAGLPQANGKKVSATTVNTYTKAIKGFFKWLQQEGIIDTDTFAGVRTPKLPKRLLKLITKKAMVTVFDSVAENPRETALLLLLLDSGITLSEVAELDGVSVDTTNGTLRVFREKTQKERYAYFSTPTAAAIEAYRIVLPQPVIAPRLFLTQDGYPLTLKRVQKILERVGKKAGISQRLSPHKLRHSFATWSLKHGSNLEYIRIMLGHSDIRTTPKTYLHVANTDVAEASKRTSPVVNLGICKSTCWLVKPGSEKNSGHLKRYIVSWFVLKSVNEVTDKPDNKDIVNCLKYKNTGEA